MVNRTRAVDKICLVKKSGHFPKETMAYINQVLRLHYELE